MGNNQGREVRENVEIKVRWWTRSEMKTMFWCTYAEI